MIKSAGRHVPLQQPRARGEGREAAVREPVPRHRHDRAPVLDFAVRPEVQWVAA